MIKVFGDKVKKGTCPSEEVEQKAFIGWLKETRPYLHAISIHPKNEGKRSFAQAARDRAMGCLNKGAVDIIIPTFRPFVCELKIQSGGVLSDKQLNYLVACSEQGAFSCIALGCEGAKLAIKEWELMRCVY